MWKPTIAGGQLLVGHLIFRKNLRVLYCTLRGRVFGIIKSKAILGLWCWVLEEVRWLLKMQ